jgi:hypothetical protein
MNALKLRMSSVILIPAGHWGSQAPQDRQDMMPAYASSERGPLKFFIMLTRPRGPK